MLDHTQYPTTTLFMLMSIDGKISTGVGPNYDVDADFPKIPGLREGLQGYYNLQSETDWWCLVSGKTMAKIGANAGSVDMPQVAGLHRVIYGLGGLTTKGISYLADRSDYVHFIVKNTAELDKCYEGCRNKDKSHWTAKVFNGRSTFGTMKLNYKDPLAVLYYLKCLGCDELTVQTGGTINGAFVKAHAIDYINVVMAPCLIGGMDVPTLIDGDNPSRGLGHVNTFTLIEAKPMPGSYLQLRYKAN